jgi:parallel beta-helix repeat protein
MHKIKYFIFLVVLSYLTATVTADPGTTFTYQGRLANGNSPIETVVDLRFSLYDASTSGSQVGSSLEFLNTAYDGGIVQLDLDFGAGAFTGDSRWLNIELANPTGDSFTALTPRIRILPTPYSIYAETAGSVEGGIDDADADPANELQTISLNGSDLTLSNGGGTVSINDADPDSSNELNTGVVLNGRTLEITDAAGTQSVDLSPLDAASRTAIDSLPFDINASGSYYLAASLSAAGGVTINANNVTLDLNGFTLTNTGGDGILAGTFSGICIQNGIVSGCGADGIDVSSATNVLIKHMKVIGNTATGIRTDEETEIVGCTVNENLEHGIIVVNECIVRDNTLARNSNNNGESGILISGNDNIVADNRVVDGRRGIQVNGVGNQLTNNFTKGSQTTFSFDGDPFIANMVINQEGNLLDLLISEVPYVIPHAANATLTGDVFVEQTSRIGILIESDNVTIDLNGFSLVGLGEGGTTAANAAALDLDDPPLTTGVASNLAPGIKIEDDLGDIVIRNGTIRNWGDSGIFGDSNVRNSLFEDLILTGNDDDGISVGDGNIIKNCIARLNGEDGIFTDNHNTIINCTAEYNGRNGINALSECTVKNCTVNNNNSDGIFVNDNSRVQDCLAFANGADGIDATIDCQIVGCVANENDDIGIEVGSSSTLINCTANENQDRGFDTTGTSVSFINCNANDNDFGGFDASGGSYFDNCRAYFNGNNSDDTTSSTGEDFGFRIGSDSFIRNCVAVNNGGNSYVQAVDGAGIICIGTGGSRIEGNTVTDNRVGIVTTLSGGFIIKNSAEANNTNYSLASGSAYGPIVNVDGSGDMSSVSNADHPWANFEF